MTTNVLIAFGGVALLGILGFAFVWLTGAAAQHKEPPSQTSTKSDTPPLAR
jgi:hypothetical protein